MKSIPAVDVGRVCLPETFCRVAPISAQSSPRYWIGSLESQTGGSGSAVRCGCWAASGFLAGFFCAWINLNAILRCYHTSVLFRPTPTAAFHASSHNRNTRTGRTGRGVGRRFHAVDQVHGTQCRRSFAFPSPTSPSINRDCPGFRNASAAKRDQGDELKETNNLQTPNRGSRSRGPQHSRKWGAMLLIEIWAQDRARNVDLSRFANAGSRCGAVARLSGSSKSRPVFLAPCGASAHKTKLENLKTQAPDTRAAVTRRGTARQARSSCMYFVQINTSRTHRQARRHLRGSPGCLLYCNVRLWHFVLGQAGMRTRTKEKHDSAGSIGFLHAAAASRCSTCSQQRASP